MKDQASFSAQTQDGIALLHVMGEIDILNAGDFRDALTSAVAADTGPLVVVLSGVRYFDSQTLEILVDFAKRLTLTRRRMLLVAGSATPARRLLDVSAISSVIPTHDSVEEAVGAAALET